MMNELAKAADSAVGKVKPGESTRPVDAPPTQAVESPTETMRAITWQGRHNMKLETVPRPLLSDPRDAIIKITACSICSGSDGHMYAGEIPTLDKGLIIGHEGMGVVEKIGDGVKNLKVGQRVVISFCICCGECEPCKKENFTACEATNDSKLAEKFYGHRPAGLFGYSRLLGNYNGSQAEYVRVPYADVVCYPVPDDVPDEKALYISDVLSTSLHSAKMGEVKEGDAVVIWGLGPIGLCAARWCQILGARRVIGIDLVPERLALARDHLKIEVIDRTGLSSEALITKIFEMEPKGADVTIEAVGFRFAMGMAHKIARAVGAETDTPEIVNECMKVTKPYGHVSIIGDYAGYCHGFFIGEIMFKHLTVRSGQCPVPRYFKYVMDKLQDGTFDPTFMITNRIRLEDIPEAYEKLDKKQDGYIKVFVRP